MLREQRLGLGPVTTEVEPLGRLIAHHAELEGSRLDAAQHMGGEILRIRKKSDEVMIHMVINNEGPGTPFKMLFSDTMEAARTETLQYEKMRRGHNLNTQASMS